MITPLSPVAELAALNDRIDELQRQCDTDGAALRDQLTADGRPATGYHAAATPTGRRLVANRLELIRLRAQLTEVRARARRHHSATRN